MRMPSRRQFLAATGAGLAGIAAGTRIARALGTSAWSPYADAIAIDGASGTNLVFLEKGDPGIPAELAAARACGLSATLLTVAPQGQFWLDDAAFQRAKANIDKWLATIAAYPDTLMLIRDGADLRRAHRDRKLGTIFGFQGT